MKQKEPRGLSDKITKFYNKLPLGQKKTNKQTKNRKGTCYK